MHKRLLLTLALTLTSCAAHRHPTAVTSGPRYAYADDVLTLGAPGQTIVVVAPGGDLKSATSSMHCPCAIAPAGQIFLITRPKTPAKTSDKP